MCVCVCAGLQVSITGLERELHHYTLEPTETSFDLKSVPLAAQPLLDQRTASPTPGEAPAAVKTTEKVAATRQDVYAGQLLRIALIARIVTSITQSASCTI